LGTVHVISEQRHHMHGMLTGIWPALLSAHPDGILSLRIHN